MDKKTAILFAAIGSLVEGDPVFMRDLNERYDLEAVADAAERVVDPLSDDEFRGILLGIAADLLSNYKK